MLEKTEFCPLLAVAEAASPPDPPLPTVTEVAPDETENEAFA